MNMRYSGSTAIPAYPRPACGLTCPDSRVVSVRSVAGWLAEGFRIARKNPVLWLAAILTWRARAGAAEPGLIDDMMELRLIIEPNAARLAAKRATADGTARGALAPRF
ncbi:hypothetical protein [Paraburkholderia fungorum]|uniref:hypothetical protein n=1 Tax=Paraburkholderia fungorum TaxID=134537 RepID=UPI0017ADC913|nr:hypothetical protein [Paraburkholderia fungorum]MBB5540169.1 hypothetical protein [Paraburkholderia fungorum]